jgi:hypothetical protein
VYYVLLYTFINFFLIGVYISILQLELFTAFLWLVECSVLFVMLLLLFYLNVKGSYNFNYDQNQNYIFSLYLLIYFISINSYTDSDSFCIIDINTFNLIDNYYEALYNNITNDLFGFSISYYLLNGVEFIFIGFLLLIGSVVCVNLHVMHKNIKTQPYSNLLSLFNFFTDFVSFSFFKKQNLTKQGNVKSSLKLFSKK